MSLINLKLLSKFHIARRNCSRVKQKSEISHLLFGKWPSKKKGTRDASVGRSNKPAMFFLVLAVSEGSMIGCHGKLKLYYIQIRTKVFLFSFL